MNQRRVIDSFLTSSLASPQASLSLPTIYANDTESLFSAASAEAILPTIYPRLRDLHRQHLLPPEITAGLQAVTQLNAERNQFILDEFHAFAVILNRHGIQPLVLKGVAYLLTGAYSSGQWGSRYLYDVDLVIPEAQIPAAQAALHHAGYRPDAADTMARFRHHHAPLRKAGGGISFELHHSLSLGEASRRLLTVSEMLTESTPLEWRGVQLRVPSSRHLVTHLILHSQIRHPYHERIWPPLRAMYDLLLLNSRFGAADLDWSSIENRFGSAGQHTTFKLHLLQVEKTLGMIRPVPITLSPFEKLRWFRRNLLNRWPALRFVDPTYLFLATLSRRLRLLRSLLATPGGWKSALQMFVTRGFYRRLLDEIL